MKHLIRRNRKSAKRLLCGDLNKTRLHSLDYLSRRYGFSIALGDLLYLDGHWYVSHAGLLRLAQRRRCAGIRVQQVRQLCDPAAGKWVFKATAYKFPGSIGFSGFGDADPANVSPLMHGAEMRVAETRAVNRALRKAYGIGLCSVEELGSFATSSPAVQSYKAQSNGDNGNGPSRSEPRLRDRLCLIIRQFNLDPGLVKAYAADFCGTQTLKDASRDLVESFICHLAEAAKTDLDGLICKLNSYAQTAVKP
ncbi:MAG: hypothetical protein WB630_10725 [Candidatus Acidiferrales bacterium]